MSYTKLFSSILDSTIWQEDLHVKIVWITLLAMADRDGIVEASVPGLARRANVTIAQAEESLSRLSSPDRYSRTQEHEGRRIAELEEGGGWQLLNFEKYRDKLDAEDQRAKAAARQQRRRDRQRGEGDNHAPSRDVTFSRDDVAPNRDESRPVAGHHAESDTRSAQDQDQRSCVDLDRPALSVLAADPEQRPGGDLVHRGRFTGLVNLFLTRLNVARVEVAAKHHLGPVRSVALMGNGGGGERELTARLLASADPSGDLEHVLDVAIAEADVTGELRWLGWSLASEKAWRSRLASTVAEVSRWPRKQGSVFDGVADAVRDLERDLAGGGS